MKAKNNPFNMEIERRFADNPLELDSFLRGTRQIRITKEEIEDRYDISIEDFAYYAEITGYRIIYDKESILIFK